MLIWKCAFVPCREIEIHQVFSYHEFCWISSLVISVTSLSSSCLFSETNCVEILLFEQKLLNVWMFLVNCFNNLPNKWRHICHEGRANLASLESIIIILSCSEVDIYKVFAKLLFWVHLCSYVSPEFLLCVWSQNLATIINHHHPLQSDDVHSTS